jgi:hypothetical protein
MASIGGKIYDMREAGKLKAYRYDDDGRYLYELIDDSIFYTMNKDA